MNAFEAAEKNGRADDLQRELEDLFDEPEHRAQQGRHLDPGNLPAGDRDAPLTR